jgi:glycosyltransferase involved in cell wall biosynthesis
MSNPLITFVVLGFNQEQFAPQAAGGALAQTYQPLQVIFSDDSSSDRTHAIFQEAAAAYRGPHRVMVNRNPSNLGLGAHISRLMELAEGELVAVGAGDDVSYPERVATLFEAYVASGRQAMLVFSGYDKIDQQGRPIAYVEKTPPPGVNDPVQLCRTMFRGAAGCANMWHRRLFDVFGPLRSDVWFEDNVLLFRAALAGKVAHVRQPLLGYRVHSQNITACFRRDRLPEQLRIQRGALSVYRNCQADLEVYRNVLQGDDAVYRGCRREIERRIRLIEAYLLLASDRARDVAAGLVTLALNRGHPLRAFRILSAARFRPAAP